MTKDQSTLDCVVTRYPVIHPAKLFQLEPDARDEMLPAYKPSSISVGNATSKGAINNVTDRFARQFGMLTP